MGIVGGAIGSAIGIVGSIWLGKTVFGAAAQPRWIVYPVSVGITIIVSVASAFPLRRLASVRPASVFRGEV
jgi:ABC-type antimicrobial peptide transport system permease subunit